MGAVDPELLAQNGWAVGFLVTSLQLSALVMTGFLWLTFRAYRHGDTSVGVLFTVLLLLVGGGWVLGVLLGLILGWVLVRRWRVGWFMAWWSALILLTVANLTLAVVMRKMSREEWREWFGWLPEF